MLGGANRTWEGRWPALAAAILVLGFAAAPALAAPGYQYFVTGNPADVTTPMSGGRVLMGGGADVDAAFTWMLGRAGGGDFLVIRANGTDAYNPYIYGLGSADSVATLVIKTKNGAQEPFVAQTIRNAEALFIAGGDQADYVRLWKGTPVEDAIHYVAAKNAPIGGTSAGLAILGEFSFAALNGSITSSQALADPFSRYMSLERDFLHLTDLEGVITDSHFVERDRMGRFLAFLARIVQQGWSSDPRGIAIDVGTALLVEPGGRTTLVGWEPDNAAYFVRVPGAPEVCQAKTPLTYRNLSVQKMLSTGAFNLGTWNGTGLTSYSISAEAGVLVSTQVGGNIY